MSRFRRKHPLHVAPPVAHRHVQHAGGIVDRVKMRVLRWHDGSVIGRVLQRLIDQTRSSHRAAACSRKPKRTNNSFHHQLFIRSIRDPLCNRAGDDVAQITVEANSSLRSRRLLNPPSHSLYALFAGCVRCERQFRITDEPGAMRQQVANRHVPVFRTHGARIFREHSRQRRRPAQKSFIDQRADHRGGESLAARTEMELVVHRNIPRTAVAPATNSLCLDDSCVRNNRACERGKIEHITQRVEYCCQL